MNTPGVIEVLMVEDNPGDARLIRELLSAAPGLRTHVTHARTAAEAVERLARQLVDIVLLDLSLPDSGGVDTVSRICRVAGDAVTVIITGSVDDVAGSGLLTAGAQDFLLKEALDPRLLGRTLRNALERRQVLSELRAKTMELEKVLAGQRALLEHSVSGILVIDREGTVRYSNPAATALLGRDAAEVTGVLFGQLAFLKDMSELTLHPKEGGLRTVEVRVVEADWVGCEPASVVFLHDVTARKSVEATLQALNRQLEARVAERASALRMSNELLENVFSNMHTLIAYFDPQFNFVRVNRLYADAGREAQEFFIGKNHFALYPNAENEQIFRRVVETGEPYSVKGKPFDYPDHKERGTTYWDWSLTPVKEGARVVGLVLVLVDVTERRRAEAEMRKLSSAIEQSADAVMITDCDGRIEYVNPAFERVTGYGKYVALGRTPALLRSGMMSADFYSRLWDTIRAGKVFRDVIINRASDGRIYHDEATIFPLRDESGRITHYISSARDVTERLRNEEQINYLASHDVLTELPNRLLFLDRARQALARTDRQGRAVAVVILDVDRLHLVNESFGVMTGDRLLRAVARRLEEAVRAGDTVARLSGGTFGVLLVDLAQPEDAAAVVSKIMRGLDDPFATDGEQLYVTACLGAAVFPADGTQAEELLRNADAALYGAKDMGRGQCRFYTADTSVKAQERMTLETDLRHALAQGQFLLHYQPQVNLADGTLRGVEALLRWRHPQRGLVSPDAFIPLLEDSGRIVAVGDWVLREACVQHIAWREQGFTVPMVAVNLSAIQLDEGVAGRVESILRETGMDPRQLEVEVTESVAMRGVHEAFQSLARLGEMGVTVAVDDFGTGYSSLSQLTRLPVRVLKIDRSFVHGVPGSRQCEEVARTIIALAKSLKLRVVAEGVETEAQAAFLRECGCDAAQGYLLGAPAAAGEIAAQISNGGFAGRVLTGGPPPGAPGPRQRYNIS